MHAYMGRTEAKNTGRYIPACLNVDRRVWLWAQKNLHTPEEFEDLGLYMKGSCFHVPTLEHLALRRSNNTEEGNE